MPSSECVNCFRIMFDLPTSGSLISNIQCVKYFASKKTFGVRFAWHSRQWNQQKDERWADMERVRRVELPTLCLASIRSSQLSYTRVEFLLQQGCRFVNYSRLQRAPNARISNGKTAGGSWRQTTLRQPPKRRENTFPERKNRSPSTDSE